MALSSLTEFEVRSTGSDTNGGGFVNGATGVDYSQQDAAQYALTSLTTAAANAIILTASAASDMVGNLLRITGGTNFTVGVYQITSVSVGVSITVDRNCTSAAGAAGTCNIGGGLATIAAGALLATVTDQILWIKAATYTLTVAINITASISVRGYNSSRTEAAAWTIGTRPLITCATNSINLFEKTGTVFVTFMNLNCTHTAVTTRGIFYLSSGTISGAQFYKIKVNGCLNFIGGSATPNGNWYICRCEILNCTGDAITASNNGTKQYIIDYCRFSKSTGCGINLSATQLYCFISNCIFDQNTSHGVQGQYSSDNVNQVFKNCIFYKNGGNGILVVSPGFAQGINAINNIFYLNTGYGIRIGASTTGFLATSYLTGGYNAYGANTVGDHLRFPATDGDVALSGSPFTDGDNGDFTLNNTAGAGASCKQVGYPTTTIP